MVVILDKELKKELDEDKESQEETEDAKGLVEEANVVARRLEDANEKQEELLNRADEAKAKEILSGKADAGEIPEVKKKLTDEQYADAMTKGEVDPFKEDGFV